MFRKPALCAAAKTAVLIVALAFYYFENKADMTFCVISALAFCCAFCLELIIDTFIKNKTPVIVIETAIIAACLLIDYKYFFPVMTMSAVRLAFLKIKGKSFFMILSTCYLLSVIIIEPPMLSIAFSLTGSTVFIYLLVFEEKLRALEEQTFALKEQLAKAEEKLSDNKRLVRSLKYSAALEERNRLAVMLHDNVGHSISGSIIMLEAAMLNLEKNPEKAKTSIQTAVSNLRTGVDEIRAALREEKPVRSDMGINDIQNSLDSFALSYGIKTSFDYAGPLDLISPAVWSCIYESLKEALTNVLK
ncbi:MAG: histidine kinase, partial [Oscillospiraceae bacterium]